MTITFRVKDEAATSVMRLHLTTLRVAALCKLLGQHAARYDDDYIFPIHGTPDTPGYAFEARVCPIPLAELSRVFYHYEPAIALFDEAQYHRRRVRISRSARHPDPILDIAASSDNAPQLAMTNVHAYALLNTLGLRPDSYGAIPIADVRQRLIDPAIRQRLDADPRGIGQFVPTLDQMAALKTPEGALTIAWT